MRLQLHRRRRRLAPPRLVRPLVPRLVRPLVRRLVRRLVPRLAPDVQVELGPEVHQLVRGHFGSRYASPPMRREKSIS